MSGGLTPFPRTARVGAPAFLPAFRPRISGQNENTVTADGDGRLQNLDFSKPGIYSIADRTGQEIQRLAVNVPVEESDLAALTGTDFQKQLARTPEPHQPTVAASLFGSDDHRKDLARLLLLAGLGLLFAETFLANRTYA